MDLKGICGGVPCGNQQKFNWDTWTLPMDNLKKRVFGRFSNQQDVPAFHRGSFEVKELADTFLKFPGVKGVVWINGFNLGRSWNEGPASTLYVPSPLLKAGLNAPHVEFVDTPQLG